MDPTAAWKMFLYHLVKDELSDAVEYLDSLIQWLKKGGYPPLGFTYNEICALTERLATSNY